MRSLIAALVIAGAGLFTSSSAAAETETAIFAGGCFWCVESDFDHVEGVLDTTSGYAGGTIDNPTYENHPDYIEAVKLTFDPSVVSYEALLTAYWHSVDPTDGGGQFCDRGHSYLTTVYVDGPEQRAAAEASKQAIKDDLAFTAEIFTPIVDATTFYPAEDYHQDYHLKNPIPYEFYRFRCGRNARVDYVWGDTAYKGINH
ncbi:MAG: peptide-methionine (S)-S-oxide reductase MsrA [Alphaproteobacteria bacterium]|nr:peptide-methionine (S)-S-oxide reductase MsrA [Alphaproteobacteria bacterium]